MTTNQNLPCPFCEITEMINLSSGSWDFEHPENKCALSGIRFKKEEWNTRTPHPLEKKVEEFRKILDYWFTKDGTIYGEFIKLFGDK